MNEKNLQTRIHLATAKLATLFRNNTGMGWIGKIVKQWTSPNGNRYITIENPRPLHAGLTKGSSDLIGWKSITITPEMVGKKIAVFTALEVKIETGKPTLEQENFIAVLNGCGGIGAIVKNENQAIDLLK